MVDFDFSDMTDEELYELIEDAQTELGRRQTAAVFGDQLSALLDEGQAAGVIVQHEDGTPWEPVTGYHNVYRKGAVHTHNGKTWVSNIDFNAGEPGVSGWTEQVEDNEDGTPNYPVWQHNGGYEDNWAPGSIVWFPSEGDQLYINTYDNPAGNGWRPDEPGSQWEPWDGEQS